MSFVLYPIDLYVFSSTERQWALCLLLTALRPRAAAHMEGELVIGR